MTNMIRIRIAAASAAVTLTLATPVAAEEPIPSPDREPETTVEADSRVDVEVLDEEEVPETEPVRGIDSDGYGPGYEAPPPAPMGAEEGHEEALYAQDVLKVATSVGLAATGAVGLVSAINQPTAFGDGRCSDDGVPPDQGEGIGGNWGCQGMNIVHAALGVGTTLLYTSEQVTGLAIPGDEPDHGAFHEALSYVHIGGMVLTPAFGLLSANPRVFGIDDDVDSDWPRVGRTIHMGVAVLTAGAYWTTTLIELSADAPITTEQTASAPPPSSDSDEYWGGL